MEIEFRGRREGRWYYGSLVWDYFNERYEIHFHDEKCDYDPIVVVERDTIGQYTGLKDKNHKKIYKDDIVKVYLPYKALTCVVKWEDCGYVIEDIGNTDFKYSLGKGFDLKVIGNIHDAPKTIGGVNEIDND